MQVTAGYALDLNPGRDYWQSHVTHKIHLGKSWGMWKSSSNEVTNGLLISVTSRSQKGGPDDKTDQQPEKDDDLLVASASLDLMSRRRSFSLFTLFFGQWDFRGIDKFRF
jgi:hypothetical protein